MTGISAFRTAPNLNLITQLPSDGLVMSSGRKRIYNAYVAGMRDIENIAKSTKLSDSFVGVTLRRLSEVGMIKREINMKKGGVEGKVKRKVKCLNPPKADQSPITSYPINFHFFSKQARRFSRTLFGVRWYNIDCC